MSRSRLTHSRHCRHRRHGVNRHLLDTCSTPTRHSPDTVDTVDTSTHQGSKLNLGGNSIGDVGAKALAAGVTASSSMATLYLYGNHISDDAKKSLRDAVQGRQGFSLCM